MKPSRSGSNSRDLKVLNRLAVLNTIRKQGLIARYEVAKITGLTPPTVTVIVNELIETGVVKEVGSGESSGGRKPVLLELNPRAGFIFAIRLQHGEIVAALLNIAGDIIESRSFKLDTTLPEVVAMAVKESFDLFIERAKIPKEKILCCGVASPGLVDFIQGTVKRSSNLGWRNVPFGPMLSEHLNGIPVYVENISNAAALGEKVYGSGRGVANLIYLNLSVGIGAGFIINDEIYNGVQGYAGEVGHMVLFPENGPKCSCGQYGCFESACGVRVALERIKAETSDEVFERLGLSKARFSANDLANPLLLEIPEVKKIIYDIGRLIGIAIANLVSLFNIQKVILGGELSRTGEVLLDTINKTVKERTLPEIGEPVHIICSTMREDPPLMGAYALVLEKAFSTDEWLEIR
ncbi:MAG: ROK family transcriptional regulator [Bacteroidota bacterium]